MSNIVGKYEIGKAIASGDFDCRIRHCTHIITGAQYAVRIYEKAILAEASWMWNGIREAVQVMRTLPKHENIVEMVECFETKSSLYILMQLTSPTSMTKIFTDEGREIPLSLTRSYFQQVVKGLLHMHERHVVHMGIAPDHVMVDSRDIVKIGNLVSCRFCQPGQTMNDIKGTTHTVAPEVLRQNPYDPYLADAWGMGVLLYFMLNGGRYPHDAANTSRNILNHKMRRMNPALPESAKDLINELLEPDPAKRMTVADILSHPWMTVENREEDHEYNVRRKSLSSSIANVDSTWDESSKTLNITLPVGLSKQEEAAYILQHTWRAYRKRQKAMNKTMSMVKGSMRGMASFRIKRLTSTVGPMLSSNSRRSSYASATAAAASQGPTATSATAASTVVQQGSPSPLKNIMQCNHCGRLPPPRIQAGKLPYPSAHFDYDVKSGTFQEKKKQLCIDF
jgi:serine/threonine protein kinase